MWHSQLYIHPQRELYMLICNWIQFIYVYWIVMSLYSESQVYHSVAFAPKNKKRRKEIMLLLAYSLLCTFYSRENWDYIQKATWLVYSKASAQSKLFSLKPIAIFALVHCYISFCKIHSSGSKEKPNQCFWNKSQLRNSLDFEQLKLCFLTLYCFILLLLFPFSSMLILIHLPSFTLFPPQIIKR